MTTKIGIIIGSINFDLSQIDNFTEQEIVIDRGIIRYYQSDKFVLIPRHGKNRTIPPHKVNHHANISAFAALGVEKVIGFSSVGSLNPSLKPPMFVLPDDYINLWNIPTYYDTKIVHVTPGLDTELSKRLYEIMMNLQLPVVKGGIYIQTIGPRLETKAEINMLKNFGDVIGMTMASEATLAKETKLQYVNISAIDNFCNGITDEPLDFDTIRANQEISSGNIFKLLQVLTEL